MNTKISRAVLWRLGLGLTAWAFATACGSTGGGCGGCNAQEIPGGFPQEHRFDNAMQVRLSNSGITFMEQNFGSLIEQLVPGGLSFDIPSTSSSGMEVCTPQPSPPCSASASITSVSITPTPQSTAKLKLRATVSTSVLKVKYIGVTCDATFHSDQSGKPDIGLEADINFEVQANNNNKLGIVVGQTSLEPIESGDLSISGNLLCTFADALKPLFTGFIEDALVGMLDDMVASMLKDVPLGDEGRMNLGDLLASFSPGTSGWMDYLVWAGGYATAEQDGMSLGVMGGFRAAQHHPCVPSCEVQGAHCMPPQKAAISRSEIFRANTRPHDGKAFDVGIGVHKLALDAAAYALYDSGALCLNVTAGTVSQLTSSFFALMIPSLNVLTNGQNVPMMLSARPHFPPSVHLGKGLFTSDDKGNVTIQEPHITLRAKDFAFDILVLLDERYIRLMRIIGDLDIPILLFPDADGKLLPIIGDLDNSMTNIQVQRHDLIKENPQDLAQVFPTLMGLAGGMLSGSLNPIELPAFQGLKLQLDENSITAVDNNWILAVFAKMAMVQTLMGTPTDTQVDTEASVEEILLPSTDAFKLGPAFDPSAGPAVTLKLSARVPSRMLGSPVEYTYRVDGGFFHPWTTASRITVRDPLFWLQGQHTVEVMARIKGQHRTTDSTPARADVVIDTVSPTVHLVPIPSGVRAVAQDLVTDAEQLELAWSIDGQPFSAFGHRRQINVPAGTRVDVMVRDTQGNVGQGSLTADASFGGGCSLSPARDGGLLGLLLLGALALLGVPVLLVLLGLRRTRCQR